MELRVEADCGNAPRKAQIRDWLQELYAGHWREASALLAPDVRWEVIGADDLDPLEAARLVREPPARVLHIRTLISHGNQVAAEGATICEQGLRRCFAHVVTFAGFSKKARIGTIVSYLHPLKAPQA